MAWVAHRSGSVASILVLVGVTLLAPTPSAAAVGCAVENVRTGAVAHTLQRAVDATHDGDTLLVRGVCVGKTVIRRVVLYLKGVPTAGQPVPTLDGQGESRVLALRGTKLMVRDLTITNGRANGPSGFGGGVLQWDGRLVLRGSASVSGNRAAWYGGGIFTERGTISLNGSSSVSGNAANAGGGIYNMAGHVAVSDSASITENTAVSGGGIFNDADVVMGGAATVAGNTADGAGGGIYTRDFSSVTLNDSASITGNTSQEKGGGVYNETSSVTLNDSASVTDNTSQTQGGGIFDLGDVYVCSDLVKLSPNDPDDPPKTLPCP